MTPVALVKLLVKLRDEDPVTSVTFVMSLSVTANDEADELSVLSETVHR